MRRLLVCSKNDHKTQEIRTILGCQFDVENLSAVARWEDIEETGGTFEENATLKAEAGSVLFDGWVVADDSGLEVDALGGRPGIHSARYAGSEATDTQNIQKLLGELRDIPAPHRSARFQCALVIARAGRKLAAFSGTIEGHIAEHPEGGAGFGYDPVFVPEGYTRAFAALPAEIKNRLSHRARALEKLAAWGGWESP